MKLPITVAVLCLTSASFAAAAPVFRLSLKDAERAAAEHSPRLQAAKAEFDAAAAKSRSQFAALWPKISFDASYRYVTEVPAFSPIPGGVKTKFGDNESYSYGPSASWLLWDSGGVSNRWRSASARARAKGDDFELAERQLLLETRLNYFQVQLGLEQVRLLADSLKLAEAQYKDIHLRERAGSSSRIDSLASHQEVLTRRRQLRQAQADLANALGALFTIIGSTPPAAISLPMEEAAAAEPAPETEPPTLLVSLEPLAASAAMFSAVADRKFDAAHPELRSLSASVEAAERTARSVRAGHYPFVQVYGKTTRDYPNGPVRESIHQNTVGVSAGLSLFEFGRLKNDVAEQENIATAAEKRREQTLEDLERDWAKARDQWLGLSAQQEIYRQSISETKTLQKLTYQSYQAGRSTYLEVQSANLRVLEVQVAAAQNATQRLIQSAILDSLSTKE